MPALEPDHASGHPPRPRRRSLLFTPAATLLLGSLLLADVTTLPHETTAGAFVHKHLHPEHVHCDQPPPLAYLVREGDQLRLADFDDPAAVAYRAGKGDPSINRAILRCDPEIERSGFWAITRERFDHTMTVRRRSGEALPEDEARRARALFAPFAVEHGLSPRVAAQMAQGDGVKTLIRWDGYLRNIGSLAVALAFLASLRWIFA